MSNTLEAKYHAATSHPPRPVPNKNAGPNWDTQRRQLRFGDQVIKNFRWPADNQERILNAFQEECWPTRIDDPLSPTPNVSSKRRLHDTLKSLNRNQTYPSVKFRGDGTGTGVLLEVNGVIAREF